MHNTNLLPSWTLCECVHRVVVNIMILFKLFRGKERMLKYSPSTFPLCLFFFFRQNFVTQHILNSQSFTYNYKSALSPLISLSFSFLLSLSPFSFSIEQKQLISLPSLYLPPDFVFFPNSNGLYPSSIVSQVCSQMITSRNVMQLSHLTSA